MKEILKGLAWAIVGAIVGVALALLLQRPIEDYLNKRAQAKQIPHQLLSEADQERRQFTQISLNSASTKFSSLTGNRDPHIRAEAYRGLSRTFSDWSTFRYRLGLPVESYPDRALANAFQAERAATNEAETQIALVYALESLELREAEKSGTINKLLEDLPKSNTDVQYLRWVARIDQEAKNYPYSVDPETVTDLRVLIDVGDYLIVRAKAETGPDKEKDLRRASAFCDRGFLLHPTNPLVLFCRGFIATANGSIPQAREDYVKSLESENDFPKARNNLAYTFAAQGDFRHAAEQFEAAVVTLDAPVSTVSICLRNLGEAYFELNENIKACDAWEKAASLPGSDKSYQVQWGLSMCSFGKGDLNSASRFFRDAVRLGRQEGIDLTKRSTFENWKAGPRQLATADQLRKTYR